MTPDKNPDVYQQLWNWLSEMALNQNHILCSMVAAFLVAISRAFLTNGHNETLKGTLADAIVCSAIVWAVLPALNALEINEHFLPIISIVIGMVGMMKVRQIALAIAKKKFDFKENDDEQS